MMTVTLRATARAAVGMPQVPPEIPTVLVLPEARGGDAEARVVDAARGDRVEISPLRGDERHGRRERIGRPRAVRQGEGNRVRAGRPALRVPVDVAAGEGDEQRRHIPGEGERRLAGAGAEEVHELADLRRRLARRRGGDRGHRVEHGDRLGRRVARRAVARVERHLLDAGEGEDHRRVLRARRTCVSGGRQTQTDCTEYTRA